MKAKQLKRMKAKQLRQIEAEQLRQMQDEQLRQIEVIEILINMPVSIVLIWMAGYAASFGLAYLLALVFLGMMGLLIYKEILDSLILIVLTLLTIVSVAIVLISMGGYAASFGLAYLLALVFLGMMGLLICGQNLRSWYIPIVLTFLTIVSVAILLILIGGYAAYFGYLFALIFLGMGGFLLVFVYNFTCSI